MEDDRIFTQRSKINRIDKVDQSDLENSIIGGMNMDYTLDTENPRPAGSVYAFYLTERDTRVFRYVSDK